MSTAIAINQQQITLKTYEGKAVVTFGDIDAVHGRPEGTARKRFNDNKKRFVKGEDYFVRKADEAKKEYGITAPNGLVLITESGYLMLCKSFTDDLSWEVQRQLVNAYFHCKELRENEPYIYFPKTYRGGPVLTTRDVEYYTGLQRYKLDPFFENKAKKNFHYYEVKDNDLADFKKENPRYNETNANVNKLFLLNMAGFILLKKYFKLKCLLPDCFLSASETLPIPAKETRPTPAPVKPSYMQDAIRPAPKPRPMAQDIPHSADAARMVQEAKNYVVTVQTMLDRFIMYRSKEDHAGYCQTLSLMGMFLDSKIRELQNLQYPETEMPL